VVSGGPFQGLGYPRVDLVHRIIPKIIGSYEEELWEVVERLLGQRFDLVVNVGSAEGYYAIGLARGLPSARVVAFEADDALRERCRELAAFNRVSERVELRGRCDREALRALPLRSALLVIDCEGGEAELLDESMVEPLRAAHLLIETHDFVVPGVTAGLTARFARTHRAEVFATRERVPGRYQVLSGLSDEEQRTALDEERRVDGREIPQQWIYLAPKDTAAERGEERR
jgi:hypothetical protein